MDIILKQINSNHSEPTLSFRFRSLYVDGHHKKKSSIYLITHSKKGVVYILKKKFVLSQLEFSNLSI